MSKKITFDELPVNVQKRLNEEREELKGKVFNTPYRVHLCSIDGRRYFYARRCCMSWGDDKGHSMPFGGGTYWVLSYGAIQFRRVRTPAGTWDYELCDGKTFGRSANGTVIPQTVETKKEVRAIIKSIGIFNI